MQPFGLTRHTRQDGGFTLVELLLSMAVSAVIMLAIGAAYISQQRTQTSQEQVAMLQQNIRTAMALITSDLRMAGYDPKSKGKAKIESAERGRFAFTREVFGEGNRVIGYHISSDFDANGDGVAEKFYRINDDSISGKDGSTATLNRIWRDPDKKAHNSPIISNIEAVEFVYLLGDDMKARLEPTKEDYKDIRAVTVSLLVRYQDPDQRLVGQNLEGLKPASEQLYGLTNDKWPVIQETDKHRRSLQYTTVQLRNANLITPD